MTRSRTTRAKAVLAAALAVACSVPAAAQPAAGADTAVLRPVTSQFTLEAGSASLLDTYLTPVAYHGQHVALGWEHFQATGFDPEGWTRQLRVGADYQHVDNPAGNHTMHSLMAEGRWSLLRRWRGVLSPRLQLQLGPMVQLRGGAVYCPHNSNNVVDVKIHAAAGVTGMAIWNTSLWHRPLALRYQASASVLGAAFGPDHDEAYYEIYVGNRHGLVHLAWPGNHFTLSHSLAAHMRLGGTTVALGYSGNILTSYLAGNNTHIFTHALTIGIGGEWLSLSPARRGKPARTVSAMW